MKPQVSLPAPLTAHLPRLRILIVEDDPIMLLGLKHALAMQPQLEIVGQATAGIAGVEAALQLKPDLVVVNIGLPQLDGISVSAQIKAALPQTRIVILTSHATEHETIAALRQGADAYCIKGNRIEQLLDAIAAAQSGALYLDTQVRQVIDQLRTPPPNHQPDLLTQRELDVLRLVVDGCTNVEIAERLYLSPTTVKTYVRNLMDKLSVHDRVQVAVVALRSGLI